MNTVTIAEIASRLDLPESTVRYYRDRFSEFVPVIGKGRQRRYPEEAVEIFHTIADGLRNGQTATMVEETLGRLYPRNVETTETELAQVTAGTPQQVAQAMVQVLYQQSEEIQAMRLSLEQIKDDLDRKYEENVAVVAEAFEKLKSHMDTQDMQNARLARERDQFIVSQMRDMLQKSQQTQAQSKSWWQKWWGKNSDQASVRS
ncbi:MerR family transcriptional regulator [Sulfobacillus thermosulfidooxidans]|uniref:MerR family transcriptional regulator n=1 Tax=Sulfobacillus thermosulfidooxidans TaxID=28034 RepID=UPI0006B418CA|nr:MerR family transcriptional regulator [Sulfobacillus thermosulfidooxidans]